MKLSCVLLLICITSMGMCDHSKIVIVRVHFNPYNETKHNYQEMIRNNMEDKNCTFRMDPPKYVNSSSRTDATVEIFITTTSTSLVDKLINALNAEQMQSNYSIVLAYMPLVQTSAGLEVTKTTQSFVQAQLSTTIIFGVSLCVTAAATYYYYIWCCFFRPVVVTIHDDDHSIFSESDGGGQEEMVEIVKLPSEEKQKEEEEEKHENIEKEELRMIPSPTTRKVATSRAKRAGTTTGPQLPKKHSSPVRFRSSYNSSLKFKKGKNNCEDTL
eukprot:PhF_6_TR1515/c0_g1_i2/m.2762